ncbi:hypothetical protein CQA65_30695, partial [Klebsiella pneumoniae]
RLQARWGANIVIHPRTRKAIGRKRFNALIAELRQAIGYANQRLQARWGANIVIHPRTRKAIGRKRFNALIAELR